MKIRKVKSLTVVAMLAATIAGWWNGYSANDSKVNQLSGNRALLSEDVEALSQEESPNSKHYTWAHIDCGELVSYGGKQVFVSNGKHKGFCWVNPNASRGYHDHECSECNDNG